MNSQKFPKDQLTRAEIEAIMARARAEQNEAMRQLLGQLPGLFKSLVARLRPTRQRLPQAGSWTLKPNRA